MRRVYKRTFVDEHLLLNGCDVRECVFDGCIVEIWSGAGRASIHNNNFKDCQLRGDGWPPEMRVFPFHWVEK